MINSLRARKREASLQGISSVLQIILSKLTNLEVGMSELTISIENGHRIEEIVQLRNRIVISSRVETDVGENVITSDPILEHTLIV